MYFGIIAYLRNHLTTYYYLAIILPLITILHNLLRGCNYMLDMVSYYVNMNISWVSALF